VSRRASYTEGLGFGALSFASLALLSVVSSIVTARIYGIHVLGEFALVVAAANAVVVLSSTRELPGLIREIATLPPRSPRLSALFFAVLSFSVTITATVGLLVAVAVWFLFNGPIDQPGLFWPGVAAIAGYVVLDNTTQNIEAVLTSFRAGRQLFPIRLGQAASLFAIAVVLGLLYGTVWALVAAQLIAAGAALIWRMVVVRRYVTLRLPPSELRAGFRTLPDIVRFGLKIAPGALADGASNETGIWILGSLAPIKVVGAYNRAWMIARQTMLLNVRVTEMLFPTLIERRHNGDHAGFDRVLVDTLRYVAGGMLVLASVGGGAAVGIMSVFGPGFGAASHALTLLLLVPALLTMSMVQRHTLYTFDRPWLATASAFIRVALTIGTAVPLTIALGATGPALALCIGLVADLAFATAYVLPRLHTPLRRLWSLRSAVGLVAAYAGGFVTSRAVYTELPNYGGLALALALGTLVYFAALIGVGGYADRDRARFDRIVRGIRLRLGRRSIKATGAVPQ